MENNGLHRNATLIWHCILAQRTRNTVKLLKQLPYFHNAVGLADVPSKL